RRTTDARHIRRGCRDAGLAAGLRGDPGGAAALGTARARLSTPDRVAARRAADCGRRRSDATARRGPAEILRSRGKAMTRARLHSASATLALVAHSLTRMRPIVIGISLVLAG